MPRLPIALCCVLLAIAHPEGRSWRARQSSQSSCTPPAVGASRGNMFTERQEVDLGDAMAEQLVRDYRLIDDAAVTAHLRTIGDRLIRHLPSSQLRFEFFLIEMTDTTAFVLPGGRVFVSTKLVGFTETEDELAGVMAHELGHLLARQQATEMSRLFKRVLDVEQVADRADIFEKYHRMLDNAARDPYVFDQGRLNEHREQVAADRLGLFLLASAGYDALAFTKFYDRLAETKGRTGGFFSNLFGTTPLEVVRLRELIDATGSLPPGCVRQQRAAADADFRQWRAAVVSYTGRGRPEALHGVISRTALTPPLRGQVQRLRFSPDGAFVLAQDDAGIAVLRAAPFSFLFRIDAPGASEANFSPNSQRIVFMTADQRVETWSVADRKQEQRIDPLRQRSCLQLAVAPTAAAIACYDGSDVTLLDVSAGHVILERKNVAQLTMFSLLGVLSRPADSDGWPDLIPMTFSPDGRYFAAGNNRRTASDGFVYDLSAGAMLPLNAEARRLIGGGFAFDGAGRLAGIDQQDLAKSGIVSLPGGDLVQSFTMVRSARLSAPTKSPLLFVRPFQKFVVAVLDPSRGEIVKGSDNPAIDIHGDSFVLERGSGELGLYDVATNQLRSAAALPAGPLGRVRAASISNDFRWLAYAERSRGAIYDVTTGAQVTQLRAFRGAWIDPAGMLFADLPESRQETRRIVQLDPGRREGRLVTELPSADLAYQVGGFMVVLENVLKNSVPRGISVEMRDLRTNTSLWTRSFEQERFGMFTDPAGRTVVLVWSAVSEHARNEARRAPALRSQFNYLRNTGGDYFVQVFASRTGDSVGAFFVETGQGSFQIRSAQAAGDWLFLEDSENRTRVYALTTGEQKGRVFGTRAVPNAAAGLMAVENGDGKLILYDLATLTKHSELTFSHPVATAAFNMDGTRLFVMTADQTAFVLDVGAPAR